MNKHYNLLLLAIELMEARGLKPDLSVEAAHQLHTLNLPAPKGDSQDLRELLWCSIDNDDSRDLDQLTYAQREQNGETTFFIAIADVDALVPKDSPIDLHAKINTTSVYTPAKIFPMLPDKLSTDLTSLNPNEDRLAVVIKIKVDPEGEILDSSIFEAWVQNKAKLTYKRVGAWLDGKAEVPDKVKNTPGLEETLKCQHATAQVIKQRRHVIGALTLESPEVEAKLRENGQVVLETTQHTGADELIENFMIAANFVMASKLRDAQIPSLRRVVRVPKRWDRIVEVAAQFDTKLPKEPDPVALESFLVKRKKNDPETFPDLSLTIIKLLGRGEYIVEIPTDKPVGHFGLAVSEYTHSTAPNRRYPDLITQRQCKALIAGKGNPYTFEELKALADHCTLQEDVATRVERHMNKVAAAMLLSSQIGSVFKGIITGSGDVGTWVRIFSPPVEGKIVQGFEKLDVGDRVKVKLVSVEISKGFINFSAKL